MRDLFRLMRPHQWTKNALCFAGAVFGDRLFQFDALRLDFLVFLVFCVASSAVYVFNDIHDRERDRMHPKKRHRPLASSAVSVPTAAFLGAALLAGSLGGAWFLGPSTLACTGLYLGLSFVYTQWGKHVALIDVLSIAIGFILRVLAGVYVLGDIPTAWIVLVTFFLATFLGFAKRRAELCRLDEGDDRQRPVLSQYSVAYLDMQLTGASIMAVMSYALLTVSSGKNPSLVVTLPIVYYAIMRYKQLVTMESAGEEPEILLLRDARILAAGILWILVYVLVAYTRMELFR